MEPGGLLDAHSQALALFCRVGARLCALPLEHVIETMRPLPIEPLAGTPPFVHGLSIIRGVPVPVLHIGQLLSGEGTFPGRFVTVKLRKRCVALAVDGVLSVNPLPTASLNELPPLLRDAGSEAVSAIGALDAELLLVLRTARLIPEDLWVQLGAEGSP